VRSLEDWRQTRDLWDRGRIETFEPVPGQYTYVKADGTRAYQPSKMERFVRELAWLPNARVLFVLDRVRSADPSYRKAWLLHGTNKPAVDGAGKDIGQGGTHFANAPLVTFEDGGGRLRVHTLLPESRDVIVRGGPGWEFWTPGDEFGGGWGSGRNWPLDPPEGGPLPTDPYLKKMWLTFWGGDMAQLSPSNRKAVVPGSWRLEISPAQPARDDLFLQALEIGDKGGPTLPIAAVQGYNLAGAVVGGEAAVLFATGGAGLERGEATLPDVATRFLLVSGLVPGAVYQIQLTSGFAPGAGVWSRTAVASDGGVLQAPWSANEKDGRLRVERLGGARSAP
jgi:heparin/heparan-sulfate lyase